MTSSCKREKYKIVKEYYKTGELFKETSYIKETKIKEGVYKEYYENGILKKLLNFKNNIPNDSSLLYDKEGRLKFKEIIKEDTIYAFHFYPDGNILSKSKFLNIKKTPLKVGWEEVFDRDGSVYDSIEYIKVNESSLLNQRKKINKLGEIVLDSSFFYKTRISKILNTGNYQLKIEYIPANKSSEVFLILGKNLNDSFSNLNEVKLDTLVMNSNIISTNTLKKNYRYLKGFFLEYESKVKSVSKDSVNISVYEKKVFFNEKIIVSDTIKN